MNRKIIIPPPTHSVEQRYSIFQQKFLSFLFHCLMFKVTRSIGNLYCSEGWI